jgi:hypothetical protein
MVWHGFVGIGMLILEHLVGAEQAPPNVCSGLRFDVPSLLVAHLASLTSSNTCIATWHNTEC